MSVLALSKISREIEWKACLLENAAGIDKDINFVREDISLSVLHLQLPFGIGLVPLGGLNGMLELDVLLAVILVCDIVHVLMDLLRCGVIIWPIGLCGEAIGVIMCGNIALAARISGK